MEAIRKYPRTRHIEGSRRQQGDHDQQAVPFAQLLGRHLVVEEKLDGAKAGVWFTADGELRLQSRGHVLEGGARERHFDLLEAWAARHSEALHARLGHRFTMYGEWLYAKHTVFYDQLPHYFLEFDVYDRERDVFLSTPRRRELLAGAPIVSVPVLHTGPVRSLKLLQAMVAPSLFKTSSWRERLREAASNAGVDADRVLLETDPLDHAEGLYVKVEHDGCVVDRLEFVRASFRSAVIDPGSHWLDRPIVANALAADVDVFAAAP